MNIVDCAVKKTLEAKTYFEKLAAGSTLGDLKRLFNLLAAAEQEHYEALMKLEKKVEKGGTGFTVIDEAACIFRPLVEKRDLLAELKTDPDAYLHVINEQKESIKFYEDLAAKTEDAATRKLLQMIAEQERKHDNIIKNIYEFMESPRTYLAWGEFSNLKDL